VAYDWDYGDGTVGSGVNPTHTYAAAGTYTVTLTVTDDDGATDTATTTCSVELPPNDPPVADPNGPYVGTVGVPVVFDGSGSYDVDGTLVAYAWDYGDGTVGSGVNPTHTYAAAGTHTVMLTVTDDDGATATATTTCSVELPPNEPPVADPNGPYAGTVGVPVAFDAYDEDGTLVAYDWDYGDGTVGSGVNPTHTYAAAGTYTVMLTVTDDDGATATATTTCAVSAETHRPTVVSCDEFGIEKNAFVPGETVHVKGSGFAEGTYNLWIQHDPISEGDALDPSDDPSSAQETVTVGSDGILAVTAIWPIPSSAPDTAENWDIVVDRTDTGEGTYNRAQDGIDDASVVGFVAPIPELPTYALFGIGLLGIVGFLGFRRLRHRATV
jgi:PKD repeat protein